MRKWLFNSEYLHLKNEMLHHISSLSAKQWIKSTEIPNKVIEAIHCRFWASFMSTFMSCNPAISFPVIWSVISSPAFLCPSFSFFSASTSLNTSMQTVANCTYMSKTAGARARRLIHYSSACDITSSVSPTIRRSAWRRHARSTTGDLLAEITRVPVTRRER